MVQGWGTGSKGLTWVTHKIKGFLLSYKLLW